MLLQIWRASKERVKMHAGGLLLPGRRKIHTAEAADWRQFEIKSTAIPSYSPKNATHQRGVLSAQTLIRRKSSKRKPPIPARDTTRTASCISKEKDNTESVNAILIEKEPRHIDHEQKMSQRAFDQRQQRTM